MQIQPEADEIADIDPSPQDLERWKKGLPDSVVAEIEKESQAAVDEMLADFEKHADEYEKSSKPEK